MAIAAERSVTTSDWSRIRKTVLARDDHRCQDRRSREHADNLHVHHLIPRAAGGSDEPSNLITLCDGCHARRHPNLQVSLSRRTMERWAVRLALWLDQQRELPEELSGISAALRLFRIQRFYEGQLDAVLTALRNESMLVVRPTGWGKTLCFQLPGVLRSGPTVILCPLKALMKDQIGGLQELNLPGTFINGDLGPQEKAARFELIEEDAVKFLYVTPERFNRQLIYNETEIDRLSELRPAFLVVDEAHCVDRWGGDFRPDYDRIAKIRSLLGDPPVLAFTATAGRQAQDRILESLGVPEAKRLVTGADRPNIALVRHHIPNRPDRNRARLIVRLVQSLQSGKAMIFVPTVKIGKALQQSMAQEGLNLPFYHAKSGSANERDIILQRFTGHLEPPLPAVICTNAFGMGINVPDVRLVIHWQHPASVEDYLQEFGRAGRDGKPALAILFTEGGRERGLFEWMAQQTAIEAADQALAQRLLIRKKQQIADINELVLDHRSCFRQGLVDYLVGPARQHPRRSIARCLLDWVFSERVRIRDAKFCCDACDQKKAQLALNGRF